MDSLDANLIEGQASIQRARYGSWEIFSRSMAWFKIRKKLNYIERELFIKGYQNV